MLLRTPVNERNVARGLLFATGDTYHLIYVRHSPQQDSIQVIFSHISLWVHILSGWRISLELLTDTLAVPYLPPWLRFNS
jgi:hypothetical protein